MEALDGIQQIFQQCNLLRVLRLRSDRVSDVTLQHVIDHGKHLGLLDLQNCPNITTDKVIEVVELVKLEHLNLLSNPQLDSVKITSKNTFIIRLLFQ